MKIAVLGGGVIGVTTAHALLRDGHEVTVYERHHQVAAECSFANAGMIAPGHAYPWASPRAPRILLRSLVDKTAALRFRFSRDPAMYAWCLQFLRNCTPEAVAVNGRRKVRLCRYSQDETLRVAAEAGLEYHAVDAGLLYLYRDAQRFEAAQRNKLLLTGEGLEIRELTPAQIVAVDPAYADAARQFCGALYCPSDATGDARLFTRGLQQWLTGRGVQFRMGTDVERIEVTNGRVAGVRTQGGVDPHDMVVVSLGAGSGRFLRRHGVRAPVYPIKGYSLTLPARAGTAMPRVGGVDEDNLVAFAPMADGLRATATAEFAGFDATHKPSDFDHMASVVRSLFPAGADHERPGYWACLRPMTPEGTPLMGHTVVPGLVANVGHGHMGWTMACGTATITADLIAGRRPAIDLDGLLVEGAAGHRPAAATTDSTHAYH